MNDLLAPFVNNAELSDVKLVSSEGTEFFAHQCILYVRCKKLYRGILNDLYVSSISMLTSLSLTEIHSAEKKGSKVPFPLQTNSDTLLRFLKFIYCPPFVPVSQTTDSLPISGKSNLKTLMEYASDELSPELTTLLKRYDMVTSEEDAKAEGAEKEKEKNNSKEKVSKREERRNERESRERRDTESQKTVKR